MNVSYTEIVEIKDLFYDKYMENKDNKDINNPIGFTFHQLVVNKFHGKRDTPEMRSYIYEYEINLSRHICDLIENSKI
jgi:hypothetical protein